jgi:hypothetical protein
MIRTLLFTVLLVTGLLATASIASAGHLFGQGPASLNGPVSLSAGQTPGMSLENVYTSGATRLDFYGTSFSSGDALRFQWGGGANDFVDVAHSGSCAFFPGSGSNSGCVSLFTALNLSSLFTAIAVGAEFAVTATTGAFVMEDSLLRRKSVAKHAACSAKIWR